MKKNRAEEDLRDTWILCTIVVLSFLLGGLYVLWGWDVLIRRLTGSTMAAWVQAIGSIAAIVGTWQLAKRQEREAGRREQRAQYLRRLESADSVLTVAIDVEIVLANVASKMEGNVGMYVPMPLERLEELQHTLRSIVGKDLSPATLRATFDLQREVAYSLTAARQLRKSTVSAERVNKAHARQRSIAKVVTELQRVRFVLATHHRASEE